MVAIIVDIVLVLILLGALIRGASKGFILSAVSLIAVIAVFFGARYVADKFSDRLDTVVTPFVSNVVEEATTQERVDRGIEYSSADDSTLSSVAESIYTDLGVWKSKASQMADEAVKNFRSDDITFKSAVTDRFVSSVSYMIAFLLSFLLLNIVFAVIINLCNVVFKLPSLAILNSVGGAVLGVAVGFIIVFAIAWAARYMKFVLGDFVSKTTVLKYFTLHNPFNTWINI